MNSEEFEKASGLGEMAMAAITIFELYQSLVTAGFREDQAMQMMCAVMAAKTGEA